MGGLQSVYVREIRLWRRFTLVSSFETWSGRQLLGRHRFVLEGGETAAAVLTSVGIYDYSGRRFVEIDEVAAALGRSAPPRPPTAAEAAFLASHQALREVSKSR
jgi:hypothetical protein